MNNLFVFGKTVSGDAFTDREKDTAKLVSNFQYGVNTFLLSPRRWGKTSLVHRSREEWVENTKTFLSRFSFGVNASADPSSYSSFLPSFFLMNISMPLRIQLIKRMTATAMRASRHMP